MIYLEGYGLDPRVRIALTSRNEKDAVAWRDTVALVREGKISSGILAIPLAKIGVGRSMLTASVVDPTSNRARADSVRTPLFVSLGEEWAILGFDEMLSYLRYFAPADRLDALRNAPPEGRAAAWTEFLALSDPVPGTMEHEGLRAYFARLQLANERYRDEAVQGWLTDRGKVFITLGEPDQIVEQAESAVNQRGRAQVWLFGQHQLRLVFIDQTGFGHWRLTVGSESDFESLAKRERGRDQ
ncbi:MAG: GWxTD domain-containing protein [Gemmatimonadota bacterium]|nr:GWxTD domain-containing protein [Gemmatimonadota bacterium]